LVLKPSSCHETTHIRIALWLGGNIELLIARDLKVNIAFMYQ